MRIFRKIFSVILVFAILAFPVKTNAVSADTEDYVQRMIQYYLQYREAADDEIGILLDHLSETDPAQAQLWRKIMVSWAYHNSQMEMNTGILPDGLPNDDSMCIVIMGYGLRSDGTMREELIDRLVVGLSSALKYPNAYVAVTGGATSDVEGITEAGQMAQWLQERGISPDRIILEPKAMSTLQNATRLYNIFA
ncbi:MAG: YdcF family protein, partial [Oscillospiraceae bacterium]|nr:YdcF family protein [Oscillospiraceae bacterium]